MKASSLRYILPEPFNSIRRNPLMSLSAIATVAITLFLCGFFWLLVLNINENAVMMESSVEVKVFMNDDATAEQIADVQKQLEAISGVASCTFVSKDDGLEQMSSRFGDASRIVAAIDENPLPDAFTLKANEPENVVTIASVAATLDNVQDVRYGQGTVEKLFTILNWVRSVGLVIMALLALAAVILIGMNIRLTVTARREEIQVMKFVGASDGFIAGPFILEGIILALLGSVLAVAALLLMYDKVAGFLSTGTIALAFLSPDRVMLPTVLGIIGAGLVLGAIGSLAAVRKFLRV